MMSSVRPKKHGSQQELVGWLGVIAYTLADALANLGNAHRSHDSKLQKHRETSNVTDVLCTNSLVLMPLCPHIARKKNCSCTNSPVACLNTMNPKAVFVCKPPVAMPRAPMSQWVPRYPHEP